MIIWHTEFPCSLAETCTRSRISLSAVVHVVLTENITRPNVYPHPSLAKRIWVIRYENINALPKSALMSHIYRMRLKYDSSDLSDMLKTG
uniref:Uncharacterized protein n=1 Tax=Trichobilharzia regenti TaxID=157069 RepID=A0AA85IZF1_TRIRE|nr:unnamed protein product [Trichobilharzia regenti]